MVFQRLFFATAVILAAQSVSDKANLSIMTSRLLSLTAQARQAILVKNENVARVNVNAALELADRILRASPTRLAAVYTELDEVSIIEPIQNAKVRQAGQADRNPGVPRAG